jgi:hypothetical protein
MDGRQRALRSAWVLLVVLLVPAPALAGPYLGEWSCCWHPARDCPRGSYSPLHYWTPGVYKVRAWVHPVNVDQYPPGPCPAPPLTYEIHKYPCMTIPPMPTTPYADPAGYYGRPLTPP